MKISKTKVETSLQKLSKDYTVEYSEDIESIFNEELESVINEEITNQIAGPILTDQGWHLVVLDAGWSDVDSDWLDVNISGIYRCFGHYWYFERDTDAVAFKLRWG